MCNSLIPKRALNINPTKLSDEEIVSAITQKGETDLFGILYNRYSDKVYRKCLTFVRDKDVAQDMVQDVLLKVFTQLSKFKGNSRFSTWLYAVTYNFCVEYYRKNNRYTTVDIQEGPDYSESDDSDEKELLAARAHQLNQALDQIPPEEKMILLSKYQDGASIKELMVQLDISESAVKMRLSRARKRIKHLIDEAEKRELNYG
ncbi:MAG: sigma-70 family RNA polymerase sigma factor [Bacteroidota bacterium]